MNTLPPRQSDRLYHDLLAPEETQQVRARVRAIAEKVVAPEAARVANGDERVDGLGTSSAGRSPADHAASRG